MRLGLGIHVALVEGARAMRRRMRQLASRPFTPRDVKRLHVGSGPLIRAGWTNIDMDRFPGVDYVMDVRGGLPFRNVRHIYAEHFLEHLTFDDGLRFLRECRRVLSSDGVLRLSTPNLAWVWQTHYRDGASVEQCFDINKAFRAWGHQFLYDFPTLAAALREAGFAAVTACRYGESADPELRGLERHERSFDTEDLPHVIIAEARGAQSSGDEELRRAAKDFDNAFYA